MSDKLRHDTALVFNGDVLSGADLRSLLRLATGTSGADVTLHLVRVGDPRAFGCVPTDADGVVTAFLEKTQDPPTDQINAGCYVFKREVIERIPKGRALSVEREVFPGCCPTACGCAATSTRPTGATWARPTTSCAARPTWSAASRRRPRWAVSAARSSCTMARPSHRARC